VGGWGWAARRRNEWRGRLWSGFGLGIVLFGFYGTMLLTVELRGRERNSRLAAANQLKFLSIAMQRYDQRHGRFPPVALSGEDGTPLLSWRVAILPWLGEQALYDRFKLDEPWDSPHNQELLAEMPAIYAAPYRRDAPAHTTVYQVFVGPGTALDPTTPPPPFDFPLREQALLLLVEAERPVPWTKPEDLPYAPEAPLPALGSRQRYAGSPLLFVPRPGQWVLGVDLSGSPYLINLDETDEETLRRSIARDADE
jgi:hypothetical protein